MIQRPSRTLISRGRGFARAGLLVLLWVRAVPLPALPPAPSPAPRLAFVSASMNFGGGQPLPPGSRRARPELWGLLRVEGITIRKSDFSVTVLSGGEDATGTSRVHLPLASIKLNDPADPALYRWTAVWPKDVPPEGWSAIVRYKRNKKTLSAIGPIKVHFLPATRKPSDSPSREN